MSQKRPRRPRRRDATAPPDARPAFTAHEKKIIGDLYQTMKKLVRKKAKKTAT